PVTEETPQFQNFYINNVFCNGARKALFIRGLPEMSIKNIVLKNMVLQADHGVDITQAENVTLQNVRLVTNMDDDSVLNIRDSKGIVLKNIAYGALTAADTSWAARMT